jgi:cytochrome c-type biogenesis protein CcmE
LPDNLKEDIDVVVEGRLNESGALQGDRVLTRCASKYQSQQPATMSARRPLSGSEGRQ